MHGYQLTPPDAPAFSYKQVESILAEVFGVADARRGTFASRLQQLQKLKLPKGINTGRGKPALYTTWHLAELQFYFDLLNIGVTPALVASHYADNPFYTVDGWGRFAEKRASEGKAYFAHIRLNALERLTSADLEQIPDAALENYAGGYDLHEIVKLAESRPGIVIDLAERLKALKVSIAKIAPEAADKPLFQQYDFATSQDVT